MGFTLRQNSQVLMTLFGSSPAEGNFHFPVVVFFENLPPGKQRCAAFDMRDLCEIKTSDRVCVYVCAETFWWLFDLPTGRCGFIRLVITHLLQKHLSKSGSRCSEGTDCVCVCVYTHACGFQALIHSGCSNAHLHPPEINIRQKLLRQHKQTTIVD